MAVEQEMAASAHNAQSQAGAPEGVDRTRFARFSLRPPPLRPQLSEASGKYKECSKTGASQTKSAQRATKSKPEHEPPPAFVKGNNGLIFQFGERLSTGGYSRCYILKSSRGQLYAAKTISRNTITSSSLQAQIEREVRIHERLQHPNIVNFVQFIEDKSHLVLVLDYCPNKTLNDLLASHGRFVDDEARRILSPVFDAVNYLHEQFIHHGDLKLSNIFLDSSMSPKIGDFGFSKRLKLPDQNRSSLCGTPAYMAPEIIRKPCTFGLPADIWSLGVIAYALLYGVTAFDARNVDTVYARIRAYDLRFPELEPRVPKEAIDFITSMLHPYPHCRPTARMLVYNEWIKKHNAPYASPASEKLASENSESIELVPRHNRTISSRIKRSAARKTGYLKSIIATRLNKTELLIENFRKSP